MPRGNKWMPGKQVGENGMCGRYFVSRDLEDGIETLIRRVNREMEIEAEPEKLTEFIERDIYPTYKAPILAGTAEGMILKNVKWGLPGFQKGQVIFNARCETAMERGMFRDAVRQNRIVVPAVHFYEWNQLKEKNTFTRMDGKNLYMAGFCKGDGEEERFVILTTAANASMKPVHDRMPLILEESEIAPWLYQEDWTQSLLRKVPKALNRRAEYEQLSLF